MGNNNEKNIIYLNESGKAELLESIKILEEKLNNISIERGKVFKSGVDDGWCSPEYEEFGRTENRIRRDLQDLKEQLSRVQIIKKHNDFDVIDIDDTVVLDMNYPDGDFDEITVKLIGREAGKFNKLDEISINCALGKAIYKKRIGEYVTYTAEDGQIGVLIKEKINLSEKSLQRK